MTTTTDNNWGQPIKDWPLTDWTVEVYWSTHKPGIEICCVQAWHSGSSRKNPTYYKAFETEGSAFQQALVLRALGATFYDNL